MSFLPRSDVLKPMLLGFHTTYANFLWFKAVNYFGTHYITDKNYPWLVQMVDMVTQLNPRFEPAYEFAGLMVPELCNNPEAGLIMLERGITHIGHKSWKVYFYAGLISLKYYGDREAAADYFVRGAQFPSEHAWKITRMATTFYEQSGARRKAHSFLLFLLETTESPAVRKVIEEQLYELLHRENGNTLEAVRNGM